MPEKTARSSIHSSGGGKAVPKRFTSFVDDFIDGDFKVEEERDMLAFQVRKMVFDEIVETEYSKYLDSQVAPFTVHCFQMALRKVLNWNFQQKDLADTPKDWEEDVEPPPCPIDSWASFSLPLTEKPPGHHVIRSLSTEPLQKQIIGVPDFEFLKGEQSDEDVEEEEFEKDELSMSTLQSIFPPEDSEKDLTSPSYASSMLTDHGSSPSVQNEKLHKKTMSYIKNFNTYVRGLGNYIDARKFPPPRVKPDISIGPPFLLSSKSCNKKLTAKAFLVKDAPPVPLYSRRANSF